MLWQAGQFVRGQLRTIFLKCPQLSKIQLVRERVKACVMLGHILMLVTIITEEESLMRDCTYTLQCGQRLDYFIIAPRRAHQSMEPHQYHF